MGGEQQFEEQCPPNRPRWPTYPCLPPHPPPPIPCPSVPLSVRPSIPRSLSFCPPQVLEREGHPPLPFSRRAPSPSRLSLPWRLSPRPWRPSPWHLGCSIPGAGICWAAGAGAAGARQRERPREVQDGRQGMSIVHHRSWPGLTAPLGSGGGGGPGRARRLPGPGPWGRHRPLALHPVPQPCVGLGCSWSGKRGGKGGAQLRGWQVPSSRGTPLGQASCRVGIPLGQASPPEPGGESPWDRFSPGISIPWGWAYPQGEHPLGRAHPGTGFPPGQVPPPQMGIPPGHVSPWAGHLPTTQNPVPIGTGQGEALGCKPCPQLIP